MGAILSFIKDTYSTLAVVVKTLTTLNNQFQALSKRIVAAPGLPVPNPTVSYWQEDPPFPDLTDVQCPTLPDEADVVIVGSGITGVAAAKTLLELTAAAAAAAATGKDAPPAPRVVVLEARQLCGGATGRNGGHIKCSPHEQFPRMRKKLGAERARDITRFQTRHLNVLLEVGAAHPLGQVREVETVDLFLYAADFEKAKKSIEETREWLPEEEWTVWEDREAIKDKFGVNDMVVGAVTYKAGALWPYRLVTSIWKDLMDRFPNLSISTNTTVQTITRDAGRPSNHPYLVQTSRGSIRAKHVLHATNAFVPQLVPSLRGSLTGAVAHMTAQKPGPRFPVSSSRSGRSWSVVYDPGFDYVTQLPAGEGGEPGLLMVGGGLARSKEQGMDQFGTWDDAKTDAFPLMHLHGAMAAVFYPNWGPESSFRGAWTGILGFTGDTLPLVGRLPASLSSGSASDKAGLEDGAGEWVCAGYNGEGMVWAWLCGTAVAVMILGREEEDLEPGLGRPGGRLGDWFVVGGDTAVDTSRLKRANLKNLADDL